jgi:hypothetical protein
LYPSHNSTAEKQKYELKQPSSKMTIEVQKCKLQHQSDPLNPNHCSIIHFVQLPEKIVLNSCLKQLVLNTNYTNASIALSDAGTVLCRHCMPNAVRDSMVENVLLLLLPILV